MSVVQSIHKINGKLFPKTSSGTLEAITTATPYTKFDAALDIRYLAEMSKLAGRDLWEVITPFKFYVGDPKDEKWVYVPAGFKSDGATIPQVFWNIIPRWGDHGPAVVVHDVLCVQLKIMHRGEWIIITQKEADSIMLDALKAGGVSRLKRYTMYYVVRAYQKFIRGK